MGQATDQMNEAERVRGAREILMDDYSRSLAGQPHHHDASGRRRGIGEVATLHPMEHCVCTDDAPEEVHGYIVADDALERLERLVGVISEPLVVFTAELAGERDDALARAREAEAQSSRLIKALAYLVKEWPQTSWGSSNEAHDTAVALLDEIGGEGATMSKTADSPIQENTTHVTSPTHSPDRPD